MTYAPRDEDGCIVTAVLPSGETVVRHRDGRTRDALREIVERLPEGSTIESISTPRTILRDLAYPHRRRSMRKRRSTGVDPYSAPPVEVDPWSVERTLLARLGRLDLLPPRMRHAATSSQADPSRRRNGRR